ncbi:AzlC family ABC transporter permease [Arenibaculum sp.]|jgi:4-azaleucine resistance transporter AzlC|uniref:AzlC family ABC transporter permease n=1 Tax=Arenibaculum sp. TaxID=2865862 RepID=UPI002E156B0F|nr:AzlC family ABC transporter permease [Arenibaculum sp.]
MAPPSRAGSDGAVTFTLRGVRSGFLQGQALAPGVVLYGVAFGALAAQVPLSTLESLLMSALVFSGSAQLAALETLSRGAALATVVAAVLVMNARYVLYGAALRPWMGRLPWWQTYPSLYVLGDANWALSLNRHAAGLNDAGFVLGTGLATFLPWIGGTLAGRVAGGLVPDPQRVGLDFMLVAFSTTLLVGSWSGRKHLAPAAAAVLVAVALDRAGQPGWAIVGAGLAGGLVAALRSGPA